MNRPGDAPDKEDPHGGASTNGASGAKDWRRDPHRRDPIDWSLESSPVIDKGGYGYLIHPLTDGVPRCPPELLVAWQEWAMSQSDLVEDATVLVAPEAMALPLAAILGVAADRPYVVVRKRAYDLPGELVAHAETGYAGNTLHLNDVFEDDRVLVIDDVLSTGGTLESLLETVMQTGATLVGTLVFLEKGGGRAKQRIADRFDAPIRVMRRARVEGDRVRVLPVEGSRADKARGVRQSRAAKSDSDPL